MNGNSEDVTYMPVYELGDPEAPYGLSAFGGGYVMVRPPDEPSVGNDDVTYMPAGQFDQGYYVRRTQGGTTEYRGPYRTRLGAWLRITNHSLECVRRVYLK